VRTLLSAHHVDYDTISASKKRMCGLVHLTSTDKFSKETFEKTRYKIHVDSSDEDDIRSDITQKNRRPARKNAPLSRRTPKGLLFDVTTPTAESEKSDASSMISSISNDPNSTRKFRKYRQRRLKRKNRMDTQQHHIETIHDHSKDKSTPVKQTSWWNSFFG